jgi:hypothetical protein
VGPDLADSEEGPPLTAKSVKRGTLLRPNKDRTSYAYGAVATPATYMIAGRFFA